MMGFILQLVFSEDLNGGIYFENQRRIYVA